MDWKLAWVVPIFKKGAQCLPPIEETLVDIYYFFRKSTLRQAHLKELQDLCDVEQRRMLKHGCTRWLSIGRCIQRLLDNWHPLKELFVELENRKAEEEKKKKRQKDKKKGAKETHGVTQQTGNSEKEGEGKTKAAADEEECSVGISTTKLDSITQFLRSPTNKLYTMFLSYTVKVYDEVLVKLQAEEPLIYELQPSLVKLLTSLFSRLKPVAIHGKQIKDIEFQLRYNQKNDKDLLVGDSVRQLLEDPVKNHLRDSRITEFYNSVRRYFETTCSYLLKKLPWDDPLLKHAAVVDPKRQT